MTPEYKKPTDEEKFAAGTALQGKLVRFRSGKGDGPFLCTGVDERGMVSLQGWPTVRVSPFELEEEPRHADA